jgi:hypothetical protein
MFQKYLNEFFKWERSGLLWQRTEQWFEHTLIIIIKGLIIFIIIKGTLII